MTGKRKRYSAGFKAKVALEALRGELTTAQLAMKGVVRLANPGQRGSLLGMTTSPNPYRGFRFPAEVIEHRSGCIIVSASACVTSS